MWAQEGKPSVTVKSFLPQALCDNSEAYLGPCHGRYLFGKSFLVDAWHGSK